MDQPTFASLTQAATARADAVRTIEEISEALFTLKRMTPQPTDFDMRRRTLNARLREVQNRVAVIDAWIEDHRVERRAYRAQVKRAAIAANIRQSEMALERDAEKTRRHNAEREEKMRLLVTLFRKATPVLARSADPEASLVIDEIRTKAPWLIREAS